MNRWIDPLLTQLDQTPCRPTWFFRDDDAGWADQHLLAVADVFQRSGVILDVAAIPAAVSPALSEGLRARVAAGEVSVHQHGWAHVNHQPDGRRSEFGAARAPADQFGDLQKGRSRLCELLDGAVEPFFTPPWNRCEDRTAPLLGEVGLTVLSCDWSAPRRNVPAVAEMPVRLDWTRCWREGGPERLGAELTRSLDGHSASTGGNGRGELALGVMLHHATMTDEQLDVLAHLLTALNGHPSAVLAPMASLAVASPETDHQPHHAVGSSLRTRSS